MSRHNVGPRVLDRDRPLAFFLRVVTAERVTAERLEQVLECLILDAPHSARRDSPLALEVLLDQAFLLDQLDDFRHLFLELIHVLQDCARHIA